VHLLMQQTEKA